MKNFQFPSDFTDNDKIALLEDAADHIEDTTYYIDLTPESLTVKRESFTANHIEISKHQEILDIAKSAFKSSVKPFLLHNDILIEEIKTGKEKVTGRLYHIADHDQNLMITYSHTGEFISSRRLRPDEKQARIRTISSAINQ